MKLGIDARNSILESCHCGLKESMDACDETSCEFES